MEYFQNQRYLKSKKENFEILDIINSKNEYIFYILSKSINIYSVKIDKNTNTISCDCPDGEGFCKKYDCICKHSCFILSKILKIYKGISSKNRCCIGNKEMIKIKDLIKN